MYNEKWLLHNNVEWKRLWEQWSEPPPTTKGQSIFFKGGDIVYMVGLEESSIGRKPSRKKINPNKYCSQLDQLKVAFDEKHQN